MSFNQNMLEEVHGDTCRLGYLKVLSCLGDDFQPYSMEFFSSRLSSLTKDYFVHWSFPEKLSTTGLIRNTQGLTISKNYVNLAYEFGILNKKNQTLGPFGRIFSKTETAKSTSEYIRNPAARSQNVLILNVFERILFLKQLLEVDDMAILRILKWFSDLTEKGQDTFSRKVAMSHFMEIIYSDIMNTRFSNAGDPFMRAKLEALVNKTRSYGKERIKLEEDGEWETSDLYAKYRHTAPPRFEWLIDLGLIEKETRGNYHIVPLAQKIYDAISHMPNSFNDESFYQLGKIYLGVSNEASIDDIKTLLFDSYVKFEKAGHLVVDKVLFENFVAFEALELQKKIVKISSIDGAVEEMRKSNPRLVQYHVDMNGKWRFLKISKEIARSVT